MPACLKKKEKEMGIKKVTGDLITIIICLIQPFDHRILPGRKTDRRNSFYDTTAETSFYFSRALNKIKKT